MYWMKEGVRSFSCRSQADEIGRCGGIMFQVLWEKQHYWFTLTKPTSLHATIHAEALTTSSILSTVMQGKIVLNKQGTFVPGLRSREPPPANLA